MLSVTYCLALLLELLLLFPSLLSPWSLPSPQHWWLLFTVFTFEAGCCHCNCHCHCHGCTIPVAAIAIVAPLANCCVVWLLPFQNSSCCHHLVHGNSSCQNLLQAQVWHVCQALYICSMLATLQSSNFDRLWSIYFHCPDSLSFYVVSMSRTVCPAKVEIILIIRICIKKTTKSTLKWLPSSEFAGQMSCYSMHRRPRWPTKTA